MMLFVVGNIDADKAISIIRSNQAKKDFKKANKIVCQKVFEPNDIKIKENILTMDVEMNKIIISIKINEILNDSKLKIKRELAINLLFDLLFSKSSKLYNDWLNSCLLYTSEYISLDLHNSPESEGNIMTEYERKFCTKGPIYKLIGRYK